MHILHVVGARPNFMKAAPVLAALAGADGTRDSTVQTLVHTGQHYDATMSDVFCRQLGLPAPDVTLEVGSGPWRDARQPAGDIRCSCSHPPWPCSRWRCG